MEILIAVFVAGFIALVFWLIFSKKGKGLLFGGKIVHSVDDDAGGKRGIVNANVQVHIIKTKLPPPNDLQIGLEIGQGTHRAPVTLSRREARTLIDMLHEAVEYKNET